MFQIYLFGTAPVLTKDGKYLGLLELRDFVAYLLSVLRQKFDIEIVELASTASDLINFWKKERIEPIPSTMTLYEVIHILNLKKWNHVPVQKDDKIIGMMSQATIVGWVFSQPAVFSERFTMKNIEELSLVSRSVISTPENELLIKVFKKLYDYDINGLAIVNEGGKLVGNISVIDVHLAVDDYFVFLQKPVKDMLSTFFANSVPIVCKKDTSFFALLSLFCVNTVHRLYVVDGDSRPISVITLTNVIETLVNACDKEIFSND